MGYGSTGIIQVHTSGTLLFVSSLRLVGSCFLDCCAKHSYPTGPRIAEIEGTHVEEPNFDFLINTGGLFEFFLHEDGSALFQFRIFYYKRRVANAAGFISFMQCLPKTRRQNSALELGGHFATEESASEIARKFGIPLLFIAEVMIWENSLPQAGSGLGGVTSRRAGRGARYRRNRRMPEKTIKRRSLIHKTGSDSSRNGRRCAALGT